MQEIISAHELYNLATQILTEEVLFALHQLLGEGCEDECCPCWEAGYKAAQNTIGEWNESFRS